MSFNGYSYKNVQVSDFCHLVSFSATILEGRGQKRANMSTVAIMVAFILLKIAVPDEICSH